MYVYLNNKLVLASDAKVSVFDHGFLYGDGVFETMRVYDGVVFMLDEHLSRLYRSASMIGLNLPLNFDSIKVAIYETINANSLKDAYVRLTLSRGYGPVGLDPELCREPTFIVIAEEFREYPRTFYENGIKLAIAETRRNLKEAINPQIKSLNFLNNILAKMEARDRGAYEALMLNVSGHLTEGTISNVFFVSDAGAYGGHTPLLCTPSTSCGILDGITRGIVLDIAVRDGVMVKEGVFTREDIYKASEVFITNTTMEVMPVRQVDEVSYKVGNITKLLHKVYREEVRAYVTNIKGSGPSLWGYE